MKLFDNQAVALFHKSQMDRVESILDGADYLPGVSMASALVRAVIGIAQSILGAGIAIQAGISNTFQMGQLYCNAQSFDIEQIVSTSLMSSNANKLLLHGSVNLARSALVGSCSLFLLPSISRVALLAHDLLLPKCFVYDKAYDKRSSCDPFDRPYRWAHRVHLVKRLSHRLLASIEAVVKGLGWSDEKFSIDAYVATTQFKSSLFSLNKQALLNCLAQSALNEAKALLPKLYGHFLR